MVKLVNSKLDIRLVCNKRKEQLEEGFVKDFDKEIIGKVRNVHKTLKGYEPTPLVRLNGLAKAFGVKDLFVKDESHRVGLKAFKVLGASFAVVNLLCEKLGLNIENVSFDYLKSDEVREKIGEITFATASDGNHGKGLAWAARELGQKAVVYLPKGTAYSRVDAIKNLGAEAFVTDMNYDDTVRSVIDLAKKNGWEVVQDTAWEGYLDVPKWVMQGYATMAKEAIDQLEEYGEIKPTHVFLQAGVGAMAGSVLGCLANCYDGNHPKTYMVEPHNAACIYKSIEINDGKPHHVTGDLSTIMAGLSCGEPNPIGWDIIKDYSDGAFSCSDYVAARGMRILANPIGQDEKIVSGESGAVGLGLISLLMEYDDLNKMKEALHLNGESIILLFNTEGDTDPVNYRDVIWNGKYPTLLR